MQDLIPEDVYRSLTTAGEDWADKQAAADLLEGNLKNLKAKLTMEHKDSNKCSMSEAETRAQASQMWLDAHQKAIEAVQEARKSRVSYDAIKSLFDARRTVEASQRAVLRAAP